MLFNDISLEYYFTIVVIVMTVIASVFYLRDDGIIIVNHEGIKTKIVSDSKSCIKTIKELRLLNPYILGLDCEWIGKNKVSLFQHSFLYFFQINSILVASTY